MTILKQKDFTEHTNPRLAAGEQQEKDVAFYLRRAFKDDDNILVLNDYRFTYNGETAQIDHLVVHRAGFIIIESKSIYGEVKVNDHGEWSRSFKGQWTGIPSPIIQAELQKDLLRQLMIANVEKFLGKIIGIQTQVTHREWDVICTVSNNCILHREDIPKNISKQVIKSESVADEVKRIGGYSKIGTVLSGKAFFTEQELKNIGDFLLEQCLSNVTTDVVSSTNHPERSVPETIEQPTETKSMPVKKQPNNKKPPRLTCKNCDETEKLTAQYGKYGYYVQCGVCRTNTSMKTPCPACGNPKARIKKQGNHYWLTCDCNYKEVLFVNK